MRTKLVALAFLVSLCLIGVPVAAQQCPQFSVWTCTTSVDFWGRTIVTCRCA